MGLKYTTPRSSHICHQLSQPGAPKNHQIYVESLRSSNSQRERKSKLEASHFIISQLSYSYQKQYGIRIESPENPHIYGQMTFNKGIKNTQ